MTIFSDLSSFIGKEKDSTESRFVSKKFWTVRNEFSSGQLILICDGVDVIFAETFSRPSILYISLAILCHGRLGRVRTKIGGRRTVCLVGGLVNEDVEEYDDSPEDSDSSSDVSEHDG